MHPPPPSPPLPSPLTFSKDVSLLTCDNSSDFAQRSSSDHIIRMLNIIHFSSSAAQSSLVLVGPGNPVVPLVQ